MKDGEGESGEWTWDGGDATCAHSFLVPTLFELIEPLAAGTRVLDIGCGNGYIAGLLISKGCEVVGIDPSRSGVEVARQKHPAGRFETLVAEPGVLETLAEDPFDLVISTEVIEHVWDPVDLLNAAHECVAPGGTLVLSTPYHGYLKNLILAAAGRGDQHYAPFPVGGHIRFWSRRTLSEAVREAGFIDLRFAGSGRLPYIWKTMVIAAKRPPAGSG